MAGYRAERRAINASKETDMAAMRQLVSMPVKLLIRQVFRIKYVMVTPWFNI